jgi:RHS repeat-associated protein
MGNRITQTDANNHTASYAYDQRGRRTQRTLPLGQSESYTYDAAGNVLTRTDFNGKTTTYTYDNVNRLKTKKPDPSFNAPTVTYTYSQTRRVSMSDATGTTNWGYDNNGNITQISNAEGTIFHTFDAAGNLKQILAQPVIQTVNYTYDALNRLSTVQEASTGATTYSYDNVGNLQSVTSPNGVAHSYTYDTRNRLTNLGVTKGASNLLGYNYTLDAAGHRTSVTELSRRTVSYGYDSIYRLTSETIASDPSNVNGAASYVYDAVGNRTQKTSTIPGFPGGLTNYNANDQLATDTYDNDGNTTASNGVGYVYDFENHVIQAGSGISIVYDGDGNRVSKTVAGVTTKYLVDPVNPTGYAQVVQESMSGSNSVNRELSRAFVYGLERISQLRSYLINGTSHTQTSYYAYDGHGSTRALTDPNGAVTDTYDYDAFGNLIHSTATGIPPGGTTVAPTPNEFLFAGEQFDSDLNLYNNRARYLNVSTGRFWTMDTLDPDPIDPFSLHRYLYVNVNPVDGVDPTGHEDLSSLSVSEGLSEEVDATEAEAEFTAKKALSAKVIDIYHCEKFQAYIIPFHCWVYANQPGNWGFRYDIGAEESERGPGLIIGGVSGYLLISEMTLNAVRSDASATFSKEASLSELGWIEWQAIIVADFEFLDFVEGGAKKYALNYSFNTLIPEAVNCLFFTGFAIFIAKRIQNSGH